jgi:hypothetical protein
MSVGLYQPKGYAVVHRLGIIRRGTGRYGQDSLFAARCNMGTSLCEQGWTLMSNRGCGWRDGLWGGGGDGRGR